MHPIILLGAGAVALIAFAASKSNAAPGRPGAASQPGTGKYDPGMPLDVEHTVDIMLATDNDPNELREFALSLRPEFPRAADMLDTKANALGFGLSTLPPIPVTPTSPIPVGPPPPFVPIGPPPFVPIGPPPFIPPSPPIFPSNPPSPFPPAGDTRWAPGPLPHLPVIPAAGKVNTAQHQQGQRGLLGWARSVLATTGDATGVLAQYSAHDIDGIIGPRTQTMTQLFQRWNNQHSATKLTEDGLFGANTYAALAPFTVAGA